MKKAATKLLRPFLHVKNLSALNLPTCPQTKAINDSIVYHLHSKDSTQSLLAYAGKIPAQRSKKEK